MCLILTVSILLSHDRDCTSCNHIALASVLMPRSDTYLVHFSSASAELTFFQRLIRSSIAGISAALPAGHADGITGLCVSSDSKLAVTLAYDNTARLWNLHTAQCVGVLHHNQAVTKAIFSSDSRLLLTASADNIAYLWTCDDRQPLLKHVLKVSLLIYEQWR